MRIKRTTLLTIKRILVYLKWGVVCLLWFSAFNYFLGPYIANLLACLITVELFWHEDNWKEQQLMKQPTLHLFRRNSSV